MSNEQEQFEQMLQALESTDDELRQYAETVLQDTKKDNAPFLIQGLGEVLRTSKDLTVIVPTLHLLKKLLDDPTDTTLRQNIQAGDAEALFFSLIKAYCQPEAHFTEEELPDKFYELWVHCLHHFLEIMAHHGSNLKMEVQGIQISMFEDFILDKTRSLDARRCALDFMKSNPEYFSQIEKVDMLFCLSSGQEPALLPTATKVIMCSSDYHHQSKPFTAGTGVNKLQHFCTFLTEAEKHEAEAAKIYKLLNDEFDEESQLPYSREILLPLFTNCCRSDELQWSTRKECFSLIFELISNNPRRVRKIIPNFLTKFTQVLFDLVSNPVMEENWENSPETEELETEADMGGVGLDRLSAAFGEEDQEFQQMITQMIISNLGEKDWKKVSGALWTITYICEGMESKLEPQLSSIVDLVYSKRHTDNMYVRYAICKCFGQLCSDFPQTFQILFADRLLPLVKEFAGRCPKLDEAIGLDVDIFFEQSGFDPGDPGDDEEEEDEDIDEDKAKAIEILSDNFVELGHVLLDILSKSNKEWAQASAMNALSSMIDELKDAAVPLTEEVGTVMLKYAKLPRPETISWNDAGSTIKCASIQCLTVLGGAVGEELFSPFLKDTTALLTDELSQIKSGLDDPLLRYVLRGWTCIVDCLKKNVVNFLPTFMPKLLAIANADFQREEKVLGPTEEDLPENTKEGFRNVIVRNGGQRTMLSIPTSVIENKDLAATIVFTIIDIIGNEIKDYMEEIADMAFKLIDLEELEDTRETAAQIITQLAPIFRKEAATQNCIAFAKKMLPKLITELTQSENNEDVKVEQMGAIAEVLKCAPYGTLVDPELTALCDNIKQTIQNEVDEIDSGAGGGNFDEDDEEAENEEDEEHASFLWSHQKLAENLFKTTPRFHTYFAQNILPLIQNLLGPKVSVPVQQVGLCFLTDFVEHGGETVVPYSTPIATIMMQFASEMKHPDTSQAALYGIGVVVELLAVQIVKPNENNDLQDFLSSAITTLSSYFSTGSSNKKIWHACTVNAISTTLKIFENYDMFSGKLPYKPLWNHVCNHLPAKGDVEEAKIVHAKILKWIEEGSSLIPDASIKTFLGGRVAAATCTCLDDDSKQKIQGLHLVPKAPQPTVKVAKKKKK